MHLIDLPEHIADRLSELPLFARSGSLERAINRALDAEGWPQIAPAAHGHNYWYVNIWNRAGELVGHVGPIDGASKAQDVARAWQKGGAVAEHSRQALGNALTNAHIVR